MAERYACGCLTTKTHRLVLDGGSVFGEYHLELCSTCYKKQNKRYLVREEEI